MKKRDIRRVVAAVLSGPILAGLILLVPLGVLTGLNVALDPSLAIDELAPEEELLIPFILLALVISLANGRLAWIMSQDSHAARYFVVSSLRYANDPSGSQHPHGHGGRQFAADFAEFLAAHVEGPVTLGEPAAEDYGWKLWIKRAESAPIWIVVAHVKETGEGEPTEEYIVAAKFEPPLLPWSRLAYRPDFELRDEVERELARFLRVNDLPFAVNREQWVNPEPGINPGPMF